MSWQVGDLAVCVDAADVAGYPPSNLTLGAIYTVVAVGVAESFWNDAGEVGLNLAEVTSPCVSGGYNARRFRKVVKDAHEACEECPQLLKLLKKRRVAA